MQNSKNLIEMFKGQHQAFSLCMDKVTLCVYIEKLKGKNNKKLHVICVIHVYTMCHNSNSDCILYKLICLSLINRENISKTLISILQASETDLFKSHYE